MYSGYSLTSEPICLFRQRDDEAKPNQVLRAGTPDQVASLAHNAGDRPSALF